VSHVFSLAGLDHDLPTSASYVSWVDGHVHHTQLFSIEMGSQ
jgi:hypothetical protein